jgi:hypothetical protein
MGCVRTWRGAIGIMTIDTTSQTMSIYKVDSKQV